MTEPNEPTVLDYFKSIFKSRDSFAAFLRAWADRADTTPLVQPAAPESDTPATPTPELPVTNYQLPTSLPWRSLLALFIALVAQRMFEPPTPSYMFGTALYFAALGLGIWAFIRGELTPAPQPKSETRLDPLTVRGFFFILSLLMGAATFLTMTDNTFTAVNVFVWVVAIVLHLAALWLPEPNPLWKKIADFAGRQEWSVRITRAGLVVLAIVALTLFFRFYKLSVVVPEMTSDHAEKLFDVYDITNGKYSIFFERNT
ncbi:MAG: hypothetical protein AB1750_04130, partial [Chloroflexota bacterium]